MGGFQPLAVTEHSNPVFPTNFHAGAAGMVTVSLSPVEVAMKMLLPACSSGVSLSMKNTRVPLADSWNSPGAIRSNVAAPFVTLQLTACNVGHTASDSTAMTAMTGQANRSKGRNKLARPRPLANQMTRWRYYSGKGADHRNEQGRMMGSWPSTVNPLTSMTSEGLTPLREACLRARDQHHGHHDRDQHHRQRRAEAARQPLRIDESNNIGLEGKQSIMNLD